MSKTFLNTKKEKIKCQGKKVTIRLHKIGRSYEVVDEKDNHMKRVLCTPHIPCMIRLQRGTVLKTTFIFCIYIDNILLLQDITGIYIASHYICYNI